MPDTDELIRISEAIASAISARDTERLAGFLAPHFVHRSPGGEDTAADAFLEGIAQIPGEIVFVKVEHLRVDVAGDSAMVSGVQNAQVKIDGNVIDDRRAFVDMFVRLEGKWRLRAAVDVETLAPVASEGIQKSPSLMSTTPILRIFDEAKAKEFYLDFLGFSLDWSHRLDDNAPLYMQVSRGRCILHLSEHHGDASPGSAVRIETTDVTTLNREVLDKQYRYARPGVQVQPWGTKEMSIDDPFGNRVIFFERIS